MPPRRAGQLVAGELLARELVERQVVVEGVDDVLAVERLGLFVVGVVAHRVGVAHEVEPVNRHALAVMRTGQQPVDQFAKGARRRVGDKRPHLFPSRRQPGEVERQAADQRTAVGLPRRLVALCPQRRQHEPVDVVEDERAVFDAGWHGTGDRLVRPVQFVLRALGDPALEQRFLGGIEFLSRVGRRHEIVLIVRRDAPDQFALAWLAGDDRRGAVEIGQGTFASVEPQIGLALLGVGAVAGEAVVAEQRPDVAREVDAAQVLPRKQAARPCEENQGSRTSHADMPGNRHAKKHYRIHCQNVDRKATLTVQPSQPKTERLANRG